MATKASNSSSRPAPAPASTSTSTSNATPEQKSAHLALAIALHLHTWPALSLAVANLWGGPDSADKRDWLAGAILDLLEDTERRAQSQSQSQSNTDLRLDQEDVEDVLLQVMQDEFDVNVEDGSEVDVAGRIVSARTQCERGEFAGIRALERRWREEGKGGNSGLATRGVEVVEHGDGGDDSEEEEEEEEEDDGDGDVRMEDAQAFVPALVPALKERRKEQPEVDEDGFTKVVGKKKR